MEISFVLTPSFEFAVTLATLEFRGEPDLKNLTFQIGLMSLMQTHPCPPKKVKMI